MGTHGRAAGCQIGFARRAQQIAQAGAELFLGLRARGARLLIDEIHGFPAVRNAAVNLRGKRLQTVDVTDALGNQLGRVKRELLLPDVQRVIELAVVRNILQQNIALREGFVVAAERQRVFRLELADGDVQKPAALIGALLDQRKMDGGEDHRKKRTHHLGGRRELDAVFGKAARFFNGELQILLPAFAEVIQRQHRLRTVEADAFRVLCAAEAAAAGEQPDALQQIRFALRVVAPDDVDALARRDSRGVDIPEGRQFQLRYVHDTTSYCCFSNSKKSPALSFFPRCRQTIPLTRTRPS